MTTSSAKPHRTLYWINRRKGSTIKSNVAIEVPPGFVAVDRSTYLAASKQYRARHGARWCSAKLRVELTQHTDRATPTGKTAAQPQARRPAVLPKEK